MTEVVVAEGLTTTTTILGGMCAATQALIWRWWWWWVLQFEHQIDLTFRSNGGVVLLVENLFAVQRREGKLLHY